MRWLMQHLACHRPGGFHRNRAHWRRPQARLYRALVAIPVLMAAIALMLIPFGARVAAVTVLLGLMAIAASVGWWSWIAQALPENAETGDGLMEAVIQLSIAFGSTVGGLLLDMSGFKATFVASALILAGAAFLAFSASRADRIQAA